MIRLPSSIRPWALMLLMLAAATLLRGALDPVLGIRSPLLTYYPLTVFLALFAGRWPAAVAVVLSALLSALLFGPVSSLAEEAVASAIYVTTNVVLIILVERVRRAGEDARRRERAARESETAGMAQRGLLEAALVSVDAGVHSWNPMTGQAQWDARMRSLFGFSPDHPASHEALIARVHPDDRARVEAAVARATTAGGPSRYSVEYRILRADGEQRWISSTGFSVFDRDRLARIVGTARDITERHGVESALRESEQRFATSPKALRCCSGSTGPKAANSSIAPISSSSASSRTRGARLRLEPLRAPGRSRADVNAYQRAFAGAGALPAKFRFRRHDGECRWMRPTRRRGSATTASSRATSARRSTSRSGAAAEEALRVADRQKDEFLAMLAHELRNPLAPIRNAARCSRSARRRSAGRCADRDAPRQSEHLARLLDDLLDVTRIAQGRIELKQAPSRSARRRQAVETVGPLARPSRKRCASSATQALSTSAATARGSCRA